MPGIKDNIFLPLRNFFWEKYDETTNTWDLSQTDLRLITKILDDFKEIMKYFDHSSISEESDKQLRGIEGKIRVIREACKMYTEGARDKPESLASAFKHTLDAIKEFE